MDVFLMYLAVELGQVLCYPTTCAEIIIQDVQTQYEVSEPVIESVIIIDSNETCDE